jgi:tape measure domain-containing protein
MADTTTIFDLVIRIQNENSAFNRVTNSANQAFDKIDKRASQSGNMLKSMLQGAGIVGGVAAFGNLIKTSFQFGAQLEQDKVAMQTLAGSMEVGNKLFADLKSFGSATPYESADLITASKTMMAFGIESNKIMPILGMLGNVGMGSAEKMKSLALVYGQIQSTGRLMGTDLLQLVNQGFNPLTIISKKTGRSMIDLKSDMEKGRISADMVTEAFKIATSEGGLFYGMMDKQSMTLSGRFSTLKDNWDTFRAGLALSSSEALTGFINSAIELTAWLQKNTESILKVIKVVAQLIKYFAIYKLTIFAITKGMQLYNIVTKAMATVQALFTNATKMSTIELKAFKAALASTGIGLAVVAISMLISKFMDLKDAADAPFKKQEEQIKNTKELLEAINKTAADYNNIKLLDKRQQEDLYNSLKDQLNAAEDLKKELQVAMMATPEAAQYKKMWQEYTDAASKAATDQKAAFTAAALANPLKVMGEKLTEELPMVNFGITESGVFKTISALKAKMKGLEAIGIKSDMTVAPSSKLNDLSTELSTSRNIKQMTVNIGTIKAAETIEMNNIQEGSKDVERQMIDAVLRSTSAFALQNQ